MASDIEGTSFHRGAEATREPKAALFAEALEIKRGGASTAVM